MSYNVFGTYVFLSEAMAAIFVDLSSAQDSLYIFHFFLRTTYTHTHTHTSLRSQYVTQFTLAASMMSHAIRYHRFQVDYSNPLTHIRNSRHINVLYFFRTFLFRKRRWMNWSNWAPFTYSLVPRSFKAW